jgi:hypothetical protein
MDSGESPMFGNFFKFAMSEKQARSWESAHARGLRRYVLMTGILYYGGLMFVFTTCLDTYLWHDRLTAAVLTKRALTWFLAGCFFGLLRWAALESRYRAFQREHPAQQ